jgi:hypothetical protein
MIKQFENLALQRFSIAMLDRIKDADDKTKEKLKQILASPENNENPNEQITKIASTFADFMAGDETKELYFYSKVAVLLEIIQPFLEESPEDKQIAVGIILARNEELKKAIAQMQSQA